MDTYSPEDVPVLDNYDSVVAVFGDFLTVAIHTILYERGIYPQASFITALMYNCPVKQSRHPKVCNWIQDAVAAVEDEMLKCALSSTSLVIHAPPPSSTPLERFVFSTASFPLVPQSETLATFTTKPPPAMDLPEQFRATITRLSSLSSTLGSLPKDCTFTLAVDLRDDAGADSPSSENSTWIAADLGLQKKRKQAGESNQSSNKGHEGQKGKDRGGVRTTPIRSLESGAFAMEMWIEEGREKTSQKKLA